MDTTPGRNLLMEVRVKGHTANSKPIANWFDAAQGPGLRRVYTTGNLQGTGIPDDVALVVSFMASDSGSVEPRLTWEGVPQLADPFAVILRDARPGALAVLLHGRSILDWGATPLPLDLGPLGAPACLLYVEPFSTIPLMDGVSSCSTVWLRRLSPRLAIVLRCVRG